MPFTPAHAAVAWPLARLGRGRLVSSALVVGAVAPDVEYLLRLEPERSISHTAVGLGVFCLPVGLATLVLLHGVLKRPVLHLAPRRWAHVAAAAARPFEWRSARRMAWIVVSLLLASATHLGWDVFTHAGEWPAQRWPVLGRSYLRVGSTDLYGTHLLQLASSVGGLAAAGLWLVRWSRSRPRDAAHPVATAAERTAAVAALALGSVAVAVLVLVTGDNWRAGMSDHDLIARPLVGAMAGCVLWLSVYSAFARGRS